MDHIHAINQLIEKSPEYTQPLYVAFIDYEKAFDSVDTSNHRDIALSRSKGGTREYLGKYLQGLHSNLGYPQEK